MRNQKVIFLKGLPASGKSTFAKEWLEEDRENRYRANKDDLRKQYPESKEKEIVQEETARVKMALLCGKDIVIDDTNYNPIHEERFRKLADHVALINGNTIEFEIKEFDIDPITCIERDLQREEKVGKKVIIDMYKKYIYKHPTSDIRVTGNVIISDIDGTLALTGDRDIYDYSKVCVDYKNFILASILIQMYIAGNRIVFMSGREDICREETEKWIESFMCNIPGVDFHYTLLMRKRGDKRKDTIVKQELFDNNFTKEEILCVFDDRKCVRQMWQDNGLYVFGCNMDKYDLEF